MRVHGNMEVELPKLVIGGVEAWQVHHALDRWVTESLMQVTQHSIDFIVVMQLVVGMAK